MLLILIIILGVSFILYTLLGGADYGAGIIETFAGKKGEQTISTALAPVWEANHVWLILAIVILFTGFPEVYTTISTALHIPLMAILIGIILRGSSFTFRHYDVSAGKPHGWFTFFFKFSSFTTPFFLGVVLGAMIYGNISLDGAGGFSERFIAPWLNLFCITMGLFSTSLFAYIAAIFLVAETVRQGGQQRYTRLAKIFFAVTALLGVLVFVVANWQGHPLFYKFFHSPVSISCLIAVILLYPLQIWLFAHPVIIYLRIVTGIQVALIITAWFAIQFPVLVFVKNGNHLSFYNTQAPPATITQLLIALFVGLLLVIPSFYFLFKVFKKDKIV